MTDDPLGTAGTLRYVVLRHDGIPEPHFDLMFEFEPGRPLRTWRSACWPISAHTRLTPLPPHRTDYLDYEGPVSGCRGHVRRICGGTFAFSAPDPRTWDMMLFGSGSRPEGLVLRTWTDAQGQTLWDATPI